MRYSEWKSKLYLILNGVSINLDNLLWKYNIASMYAQGLSPEKVASNIYEEEA